MAILNYHGRSMLVARNELSALGEGALTIGKFMQYTETEYNGNLQDILGLYMLCHPIRLMGEYPSIDLLERLLKPDNVEIQHHVQMWKDEADRVVAYAIIHLPYCNLLYDVHPDTDEILAENVIDWAVEFLQNYNNAHSENNALDTAVDADNTNRHSFLLKKGFSIQDGQTIRLLRNLADPIPKSSFPLGFKVQGSTGQNQVSHYARLHRASFGTEYMTDERRLELMNEKGYIPELDLIAIAPDGVWAAFVVCHTDPEVLAPDGNLLGWTDPIGTHPDYRRNGLSTNLLLYGLDQLKMRGVSYAAVGTLSTNKLMLSILESVGFKIASRVNWYRKSVIQ